MNVVAAIADGTVFVQGKTLRAFEVLGFGPRNRPKTVTVNAFDRGAALSVAGMLSPNYLFCEIREL